jgi:hypothetical protein
VAVDPALASEPGVAAAVETLADHERASFLEKS